MRLSPSSLLLLPRPTWVLYTLLVCAYCAAGNAAELRPFHAQYTLSSGDTTVGEIRWTLERRGADGYRYTSASRATGLIGRLISGEIIEQSEGIVGANRIRPEHYTYQRKGRKARDVVLTFDWAKAQVVNTVNDDPWVMEIPDGTLDKLVVQLALMQDLRRGLEHFDYTIADGGKLKEYHFEINGRETLDTPLGSVETVRIKRDRGRAERYTLLWCAPQWDYLPVRIAQYRDGEEHAQLSLQSLNTDAQRTP